jgi:hypothetical protein
MQKRIISIRFWDNANQASHWHVLADIDETETWFRVRCGKIYHLYADEKMSRAPGLITAPAETVCEACRDALSYLTLH